MSNKSWAHWIHCKRYRKQCGTEYIVVSAEIEFADSTMIQALTIYIARYLNPQILLNDRKNFQPTRPGWPTNNCNLSRKLVRAKLKNNPTNTQTSTEQPSSSRAESTNNHYVHVNLKHQIPKCERGTMNRCFDKVVIFMTWDTEDT